jgi:sulfur-carrier protein adenylyltransferase/sulfurtransferase
MSRYHRQIILKELGQSGQDQLTRAKVLVVGAGGLGCPALLYLVAAGVGHIGIVDDDIVALSNLHRQVLYGPNDIGQPKATVARRVLSAQNPEIQLVDYPTRLTPANAWNIVEQYDMVLDGTDNFTTRYLLNDLCVLLEKPLIFGAISQFEGQVSVFNLPQNGVPAANYRDLFPSPPAEGTVQNCAEAGVIGVLPGIIGSLQAAEVIKIITGIGRPLTNTLLTYNVLTNSSLKLKIAPRPETTHLIPPDRAAFEQTNYQLQCGIPESKLEISGRELEQYLRRAEVQLMDIRELHESPDLTAFPHQRIPMNTLAESDFTHSTVIFICQSGKRSLHTAQKWSEKVPNVQFLSLRGGVLSL